MRARSRSSAGRGLAVGFDAEPYRGKLVEERGPRVGIVDHSRRGLRHRARHAVRESLVERRASMIDMIDTSEPPGESASDTPVADRLTDLGKPAATEWTRVSQSHDYRRGFTAGVVVTASASSVLMIVGFVGLGGMDAIGDKLEQATDEVLRHQDEDGEPITGPGSSPGQATSRSAATPFSNHPLAKFRETGRIEDIDDYIDPRPSQQAAPPEVLAANGKAREAPTDSTTVQGTQAATAGGGAVAPPTQLASAPAGSGRRFEPQASSPADTKEAKAQQEFDELGKERYSGGRDLGIEELVNNHNHNRKVLKNGHGFLQKMLGQD